MLVFTNHVLLMLTGFNKSFPSFRVKLSISQACHKTACGDNISWVVLLYCDRCVCTSCSDYDEYIYCCDRKSPSGMCAKLRTVAASNNRDHALQSFYYFLFTPYICGVVLRAHPTRDEPHIQRNANGEVATASPPFYNELHWSHILFVKVTHSMTYTSCSQHHFAVIEKVRGACVQSFTLWQQTTIEIMRHNHSTIACPCHIYVVLFFTHIPFVVNHTFNTTSAERLQQYK